MAKPKPKALSLVVNQTEVTDFPSVLPRLKLTDLFKLEPLTPTQVSFFNQVKNDNVLTVLQGCAGTGKTTLAFYHSLLEILEKQNIYKKVIIIRSAVASRDQGFLPGDLEEKMSVYEAPYSSMLYEFTKNKDAWKSAKDNHQVEFMSTSFLRGSTFKNSIIIVDEFQNMNYQELSTIITRVGESSKIVFCGDIKQTDLNKKNDKSGLGEFMEVLSKIPYLKKFEFTIDDIVRSGLCKDFIIAEENLK